MEYEKYKVIISEKAKNVLASNIAFIAKVSADAATKQKKAVIDGIPVSYTHLDVYKRQWLLWYKFPKTKFPEYDKRH